MKVTYDRATDILTVILRDPSTVAESDEVTPSVILDYDQDQNLVSIEILDASRRVTTTHTVEVDVVP